MNIQWELIVGALASAVLFWVLWAFASLHKEISKIRSFLEMDHKEHSPSSSNHKSFQKHVNEGRVEHSNPRTSVSTTAALATHQDRTQEVETVEKRPSPEQGDGTTEMAAHPMESQPTIPREIPSLSEDTHVPSQDTQSSGGAEVSEDIDLPIDQEKLDQINFDSVLKSIVEEAKFPKKK